MANEVIELRPIVATPAELKEANDALTRQMPWLQGMVWGFAGATLILGIVGFSTHSWLPVIFAGGIFLLLLWKSLPILKIGRRLESLVTIWYCTASELRSDVVYNGKHKVRGFRVKLSDIISVRENTDCLVFVQGNTIETSIPNTCFVDEAQRQAVLALIPAVGKRQTANWSG